MVKQDKWLSVYVFIPLDILIDNISSYHSTMSDTKLLTLWTLDMLLTDTDWPYDVLPDFSATPHQSSL